MFGKTSEPPLAAKPMERLAVFPQDRCAICNKIFDERPAKYLPPNLTAQVANALPNPDQIQDSINHDCRTRNKPCGHWATCTRQECNKAYYGDVSGDTDHADRETMPTELFCRAPGCHQPIAKWEYWVKWNDKLRFSAYTDVKPKKEKKPAAGSSKVVEDPEAAAQYKRAKRMEAILQEIADDKEKAAKKAAKKAKREEPRAKRESIDCLDCCIINILTILLTALATKIVIDISTNGLAQTYLNYLRFWLTPASALMSGLTALREALTSQDHYLARSLSFLGASPLIVLETFWAALCEVVWDEYRAACDIWAANPALCRVRGGWGIVKPYFRYVREAYDGWV
ncbi:hypothetical protein B0T22DRAFT_490363 [Podospora appendiculata]|uniref:Uncharacterized protein n=1 Tax=Podospora appendiculata TaxID=314037 RepID=A0AAE1CCP7_9PEZI|nr:hypothetical protein B0T22DRAFT_490363 [Podospora appendiculata]